MPKFISDDEMAGLEASQAQKHFITDDEMADIEGSSAQHPAAAVGSGLAQGGTLGFADELGALGKAGMNAITGVTGPLAGRDLSNISDDYHQTRDSLRKEFKEAAEANPKTALAANIAGNIVSPLGAIGSSGSKAKGFLETVKGAAKHGAVQGGIMGAGNSEADTVGGMIRDAETGAVMGGVGGTAGGTLGYGAGKVLQSERGQKVAKYIGDKLKKGAENLAVKATGATGREAENFAPDAGRQLLDRKIVRFGSSPGGVARNAERAIDAAESAKDKLINEQLPNATVDRNTIYNAIRKKIAELSKDESQLGLARKLEDKLDDVINVADEAGSHLPIGQSEKVRRGFDKASKWNSASDAESLEANRILANAYREAGEGAITAANPALGEQYVADKATQKLLIPVRDAAERRASQLKQSPLGGFGDYVSAAVGGLMGGTPGAIVGPAARRLIAPRLASSAAVSTDLLGKVVAATPEVLGKFAGPLQAAAQRGGQALAATDAILRQKDPEYRQLVERLQRQIPQDEARVPAGER